MANDGYEYWREELANAGCNQRDTDRRDICGFWRIEGAATKPDYPVAIWSANHGVLTVLVGASTTFALESDQGFDFLTGGWLKARAVTHDDYCHAKETGAWPDEKAARKDPAGIGHNQPDDPREALALELEGEKEIALVILGSDIDSDDKADKAAAWSKKLSTIAKKADDQRKVEKQPHMDAGAAVDAHWNPIRDDAKDLATRLKRHLDAWLRKKQAEEAERQRKAQEEADRKRREAEEAARKAQESEQDEAAKAEAERLAKEAKEAEKATEERNSQAGRTGAKVALRTFISAEITDFDALLTALKDREEVRELVQSLANRAAKGGVTLPGMKIHEEKRAA